jgi:hypothetical protein
MEKSSIEIYREKKNKVYTVDEIQEAFENSFAVIFETNDNPPKESRWRYRLFVDIWRINSDAIIKEADLCVMKNNPIAKRDQILVINKNGTSDSANEIGRLIENTGFVTEALYFSSEKKDGIKKCYHNIFGSNKPGLVNQGNLLCDEDKLLVTVRTNIRHTK